MSARIDEIHRSSNSEAPFEAKTKPIRLAGSSCYEKEFLVEVTQKKNYNCKSIRPTASRLRE
jgi:hypothetical protein